MVKIYPTRARVCVCVHVCMCACVHVRVCMHVHIMRVCMHVHIMRVCAFYSSNLCNTDDLPEIPSLFAQQEPVDYPSNF